MNRDIIITCYFFFYCFVSNSPFTVFIWHDIDTEWQDKHFHAKHKQLLIFIQQRRQKIYWQAKKKEMWFCNFSRLSWFSGKDAGREPLATVFFMNFSNIATFIGKKSPQTCPWKQKYSREKMHKDLLLNDLSRLKWIQNESRLKSLHARYPHVFCHYLQLLNKTKASPHLWVLRSPWQPHM